MLSYHYIEDGIIPSLEEYGANDLSEHTSSLSRNCIEGEHSVEMKLAEFRRRSKFCSPL